jgi:hypothetical protein
MTLTRMLAVVLAAAALLGVTVTAASAEPLPTFDFADCPTIPGGADPAQWRCEVLISHGTVTVGRLPELPITRIRTVFAEGTMDGAHAQVFGSLQADPVRVPGGLLGLPLDLRIEYAGFADFLSVGDRMGEQHLRLAVRSPLLPRTCTIGNDGDPIVFRPVRTSETTVVQENPPVLRFSMRDNEFAVPRAYGCGPLGRGLERRLGVPAAAGTSAMTLTTYVGLRTP